ncbi:MAG: YfhO family protein, partial [Candidatus Hydrogenedentes bacterium]|nr:YfhO family protein [Candidatus Hydrogenedentota bacterium]
MTTGVAARSRYALTPLFLTAALFFWAAPSFWTRVETSQGSVAEAHENSDLYQFYYPALSYGFSRIRAGQLPLWNAHQLGGTPFLADPRAGLLQPLHAVFAFLPTERAMAVHAFICLGLMGLFFAGFARSLGAGYAAALIGGTVYAFSGASAAAMSRPPIADALAWLPLLFWAVREYGFRFRYAAAVVAGLAAGFIVLSGCYALAVAALCLLMPYRLLLCFFPEEPSPPPMLRRVKGLILMGGVAIGISCVQWLPTLLWLSRLEEPAAVLWNLDMAVQAPFTAGELLRQAFMCQPGMTPRLGYVGIATLVLIPAALFHREGKRRHALFFLAAAVASAAAALLPNAWIPFGFPQRAFLYLWVFSMAALAALGADRLLVPWDNHRSRSIWVPASITLIAIAALFYASAAPVRGRLLAATILLIPFLALRSRWLAGPCGVALALLLFVDLNVASTSAFRHPFQDAPECYRRVEPALGTVTEHALGARAIVSAGPLDRGATANLGMLKPLHVANGAFLPLSRQQAAWWQALTGPERPGAARHTVSVAREAAHPSLMNYIAARVVIATRDGALYTGDWAGPGPRLRVIKESGDIRVLVNDDALPRAYWVPSWRVTDSVAAAVDALTSPDFDPARECTLDRAPPGLAHAS